MESVVQSFRSAMSMLVSASDEALVGRNVAVPSPDTLPAVNTLRSSIYAPANDARSCKMILSNARRSDLGSRIFEPWPLGIEFPETNLPSASPRVEV